MRIELKGIYKKYSDHDVDALKDVSLTFEQGDFVAVRGPSGCGKSTLLNIIGLIDKPTSGDVVFDGEKLGILSDEELTRIRGQRVGFVFQFFNLLSTLTVEENVALPLEIAIAAGRRMASPLQIGTVLNAGQVREKVANIIERVGMSQRARFYPSQLSGGEMQRTAIARAVIHEPQVLVADEPTGNLDSENGKLILSLLKELNEERKQTIVMATHSDEASSYASRVADMRDGKLLGVHETRATVSESSQSKGGD